MPFPLLVIFVVLAVVVLMLIVFLAVQRWL
jgi:hypothetical protein